MISDYAVILAILVFASIDNAFHLQTPKLIVPTEFKVETIYCIHANISLLLSNSKNRMLNLKFCFQI